MTRVLAIGDIHGCRAALDSLLAAVAPGRDDLLVTLGDYVGRGPRSREVLERLIPLYAEDRLVPILGNHDQMMLEARHDPTKLAEWRKGFGGATLASYGGGLETVPSSHWKFLEHACRDWFEIDTHFFVHANAYADLPLADQPVYMLRWETFVDPPPHCSGKIMVCGHTSQKDGRPVNLGHAICIDTWAHGGGWLTCLEARSGRVWQANERGQVRQAWIEDFA